MLAESVFELRAPAFEDNTITTGWLDELSFEVGVPLENAPIALPASPSIRTKLPVPRLQFMLLS